MGLNIEGEIRKAEMVHGIDGDCKYSPIDVLKNGSQRIQHVSSFLPISENWTKSTFHQNFPQYRQYDVPVTATGELAHPDIAALLQQQGQQTAYVPTPDVIALNQLENPTQTSASIPTSTGDVAHPDVMTKTKKDNSTLISLAVITGIAIAIYLINK